jgi:tRNA dimethylallyltransferase
MHGGDRISILVLLGPTASGKTTLAVEWAERLGGEIVSADSVQVYRSMDIGTAKPSREIRRRIPHHLVDVVEPDEPFSAARFQAEADRAIREMHGRGKRALVVGGTGLYVRALTRGLFKGPGQDPDLRRRLREDARSHGVEWLHQALQRVDPEAAERIPPHDAIRTIRALEVFQATGVPISRHQSGHGFAEERYRTLCLGLLVERRLLCDRIDARVEQMMAMGLLEEVEGLMSRGYGAGLPSMQAIGYRHLICHLQGKWSLGEAVAGIKRDTRHYARRQMTWFRGMTEVRWCSAYEASRVLREVEGFFGQVSHFP